ncbi:PepSY-associated TM helix domain-containing protein [Gilvimarinus xylanilyticus]|uniref:PepSY domain-containing protein n=1 Tax=Gilvimarinus xylanilyticus TaxID=2944139 RepID=A0A9X2HU31_9GAMM|nr:PepSY-associated TM helix domain-containing protein [Gilvimarinus xylanilyticus]MCP8898503.1 PepSY domain-containing protein [Gilvimarinus xylanilyticus]
MQRDTTKKFYIVHSWLGAVTGILLFIVAFTGALSVFGHPELKIWATPEIRGNVVHDYQSIDYLLQQHARRVDPDYLDHIGVTLPGASSAKQLSFSFAKETHLENGGHEHHLIVYNHHPQTLELQSTFTGTSEEWFAQRSGDMANFMTTFHADLHLGNPWGLVLTGLLGLTLFASVITGVLIHRKILKDLFSFRPFRSLRLLFTDTHKVLGVWGLLFHGVIGFTGAFLGLVLVLLVPVAAFVSFAGDQEKLVETFLPEPEPALTGEPATPQYASVMESFSRNHPNLTILDTDIHGWGDSGALFAINTSGGNTLSAFVTHEINAISGEPVAAYSTFGRHDSVSGTMLDAMYPLHFGDFGGLLVKVIWALLGIGTALVAVTGMMIWVERRAYGPEGSLSVAAYQRVSRFTVGSCMGLVIASLALFYGQLLLNVPGPQMNFWLGVIFFTTWSAILFYALIRRNSYRTIKALFALCGLQALGVPLVNAISTGDALPLALMNGKHVTAGVDLSLLLVAGICLWSARKLPSERPASGRFTRAAQPQSNALTMEQTPS